ncbi:hypothetical protein Naga_100152g7 [Nannochloropsis gaditana]|uniref:Uncharacterized protein n=1 Tax=Nannochloropsis gaditana TaxID=72520 RepID=W7TT17_9STRA|nr:hypothetical protein Naga_100152g7 [Nannochloropsis gaditana]
MPSSENVSEPIVVLVTWKRIRTLAAFLEENRFLKIRHLMKRNNPKFQVFTNDKCFSSPYKVFNRYSPVSPKDFAAHRLKLLSRMAS